MHCIIHAGLPKTGSTLLQLWLSDNRKNLTQQGIYYSGEFGKYSHHQLGVYILPQEEKGKLARFGLNNPDAKRSFDDAFRKRFAEDVKHARKNHSVYLISCERLAAAILSEKSRTNLVDLLRKQFKQIDAIIYFREQFRMAVSSYSTALKNRGTLPLDDYLNMCAEEDHRLKFLDIAETWSEVLGREHCHFRIYDRNQFLHGDLRKDFAHRPPLDLDTTGFDNQRILSNRSISRLEAELYRFINQRHAKRSHKARKKLKENISARPELRLGRQWSAQGQRFFDLFQESNQLFFDRYFDGQFLFEPHQEPPPLEPMITVDDGIRAALGVLETVLTEADNTASTSASPSAPVPAPAPAPACKDGWSGQRFRNLWRRRHG